MIAFTVPGEPQGKGRPRIGKIGRNARLFTPAKTVSYEGLVAHAAYVAMDGRPMLTGAVSVSMAIDCGVPASWSGKKQRAALAGEVLLTLLRKCVELGRVPSAAELDERAAGVSLASDIASDRR